MVRFCLYAPYYQEQAGSQRRSLLGGSVPAISNKVGRKILRLGA